MIIFIDNYIINQNKNYSLKDSYTQGKRNR